MLYRIIYIVIAILLLGGVHDSVASIATPYPVEAITTPYGIKAWLMEEHSLPIISIHLAFRKAGHAYDPKGQEGLAAMATELLDDGAGELSGSEFKNRLESSAITLSFSEDEDNFYIGIKTLSDNVDEALNLLKLALTAPRFETASINRAKSRMVNLLAERDDDPESFAGEKWQETYYGVSPYAHSAYGSNESINAMTQDALKHYVTTRLTRTHLLVSVVGDINPSQLKPLLDNALGDLPLTMNDDSAMHDVTPVKASTLSIAKAIPQSVAVFGFQGVKRNDPDFYALFVLNYILGGGSFESRLMKAVRVDKGLAYSVYSFLDMLDYAGTVKGVVATRNAHIDDSLRIIKNEMKRLRDKGISEEELHDAQNYLTLSFPLKMDQSSEVAQFLTSMQINDLGIHFLTERNQYINKVTVADVNRVAKKLLDPDAMTVVIVGNNKAASHE